MPTTVQKKKWVLRGAKFSLIGPGPTAAYDFTEATVAIFWVGAYKVGTICPEDHFNG